MNNKIIISVLAFFLVFATLTEASPYACVCLRTHSTFIHPKYLNFVKYFKERNGCPRDIVIATLKDGREVCLDPSAKWVKRIIEAMRKKEEAKNHSKK